MTVYFGGDDDDFRPSNYTPSYPDLSPPPLVQVDTQPAPWEHYGDSAYWAAHPNSQLPQAQPGGGTGMVDFFSSLVGGLFGQKPAPTYAPPPPKPNWILPVAIGGIALVAVAMITSRRPRLAGRRSRRSRR